MRNEPTSCAVHSSVDFKLDGRLHGIAMMACIQVIMNAPKMGHFVPHALLVREREINHSHLAVTINLG